MFSADLRAKTGANGIRRFATRALLAVGGAIAGTAVAWALTTSSAHAAEDVQQFDAVTKIVSVDEKLPVVVPAAAAVHKIDETLRAEQQKARAALPDVQVQTTVEKIAERILPQVTRIGQSHAPATARSMDVTFPEIPAPPADAGQSPAPVVSQFTGPSGATWTDLLESGDFVVPVEQRPSLPSNPFPKLPVPAPAPVQCTSCSDGSGSANGGKSAALAASGTHGTSVTRALAPSTDEVTVTPGKQPGINPD
ncbi:hypothetical protein C8D88_101658 [Lentzea atacamensis]|uniref:Uncharacterized protein n=2 Tax=Lentzea TaxID=165301 RepID=A0A316ID74_9PSEU|nr:hypothetical protein [Lentzea atacamensis]PWK90640.1 hypothetical protein C8D88_101658 [Lentzea atacamensis]RAS68137.1 hypothetical protein C8D87_102200 [Lentzea atacamensis]